MANTSTNDPYRAFNFLVEMDGLTAAGFSECSGLSTETDVIEYREGGDRGGVRKLPGLAKYLTSCSSAGSPRSRSVELAQKRDQRRH